MKVMVGHFTSESNEHASSRMSFDKFVFRYGEDMTEMMYSTDLFEKNGIELIPSIYARGHPHGPVTIDAFEFIQSRMVQTLKDHLSDVDGIFLFLHGASKVLGLEGDSAEHSIVRELRKVAGPYLPMAVVMDPHGNLSQELVDQVNILRCFRESPHIDIPETHRFVAACLIDLLKHRRDIHPEYLRVPMMLGGEKSVSSDEPMRSINRLCNEAEKTGRIMSASFHIGYIRHDGDKLGCSVVVVPESEADRDFARAWAKKIRDYAFSHRHGFHYHGNVAEPNDALEQVLTFEGGQCFLTDSGDNCGSGGDGFSTVLLRQVLATPDLRGKWFLFAAIVDRAAYRYLYRHDVGDEVELDLGEDADELSLPVHVKGRIVARGLTNSAYADKRDIGAAITVRFNSHPIDVIVEYDAIQYTLLEQFEASNLNVDDYDVVIVKQGYISDDYNRHAPFCVMAFTPGPTFQKT